MHYGQYGSLLTDRKETGMIEWFRTFSENHMILALLLKLLLGAIAIFAAVAVLGLICSFLYAIFKRIVGFFNGINERLNKVCEPCGKSSNPWGMAVGMGFAAIFWFAPQVSKRGVSEFWSSQAPLGLTRYQFGAVIIVGLMILVGVFSARLRYPLVLGVKLLRIPLDLISLPFRFVYMVTGIIGSLTGTIKPSRGTVYINNSSDYGTGVNISNLRQAMGQPINPDYGGNGGRAETHADYEYVAATSDFDTSRDGFAYLGEKYEQPRAADAGGADGYNYTVSADGSRQYYTGDYRPFSETGATVESYHVDEGYTPMDND